MSDPRTCPVTVLSIMTPELRQWLYKRYVEEGVSYHELGRRLVEAAGIPRRKRGRPRTNHHQPSGIHVTLLRRWYVDEERGLTEIARRLGRHKSTIAAWLDAAGIPRRKRGRQRVKQ